MNAVNKGSKMSSRSTINCYSIPPRSYMPCLHNGAGEFEFGNAGNIFLNIFSPFASITGHYAF